MEHHACHSPHHEEQHHSRHHHDAHAGHNPEMFRGKFWISLGLTIPAILFSHSVLAWFGTSWHFSGMQYIPALLGVVVFTHGGMVFLKSAASELRARTPGMMTLISLAIIVAFLYSLLVTLGVVQGMDFWWELTSLITIMLLGHWIEMRSIHKAAGALDELAKLLPDTAELENGKKVAVAELKVGDTVLVRPGGKVPVDGEVIEGVSGVNESLLTGESELVEKTIGSTVIGGSINGNGALRVKVAQVGDKTVLAGIMKLVSEAQASRSRTQVLADKIAKYLTYIALASAVLTALGWWLVGASAGVILERVVTVLVVACPHALGLAIPLVVAISTTSAAKRGLLIRQRLALEQARLVDIVLFDKTGTLTEGRQEVVSVYPEKGAADMLELAAAAEQASEHSVARAIVAQVATVPEATDFTAIPGRGVRALVGKNEVMVGNEAFVAESAVIPKPMAKKAASEVGRTVVYVMVDNEVRGWVGVADKIRPESAEAVAALRSLGKQVVMVTGDSESVAASVAKELGVQDYYAAVPPGQKADVVRSLQEQRKVVVFVGDGVNDAPALTQANVGIAIGAGTDVAVEAADVILASNDPRAVVELVNLSRATYRKMRQNLAWAVGYNAVALPLAAGVMAPLGVVVSPAVGAVLMSLSTIIVAINAQSLRRM